jgi:hypothetical protein
MENLQHRYPAHTGSRVCGGQLGSPSPEQLIHPVAEVVWQRRPIEQLRQDAEGMCTLRTGGSGSEDEKTGILRMLSEAAHESGLAGSHRPVQQDYLTLSRNTSGNRPIQKGHRLVAPDQLHQQNPQEG